MSTDSTESGMEHMCICPQASGEPQVKTHENMSSTHGLSYVATSSLPLDEQRAPISAVFSKLCKEALTALTATLGTG